MKNIFLSDCPVCLKRVFEKTEGDKAVCINCGVVFVVYHLKNKSPEAEKTDSEIEELKKL